MSIAVTEEQRAIQESIRQWAAGASVLITVRSLEPGAPGPGDPPDRSWPALAGLGLFTLGVPEALGGVGARIADLAAALEQVADALVPGPVLPTLHAQVALSRYADAPAVKELLPALASGSASVAVAMSPGSLVANRLDTGELRVRGEVGPVLGAGGTTELLLPVPPADGLPDGAWLLLPADHPGIRLTARTPVDFSRPLADVCLREMTVPPQRVVPASLRELRDTAALLYAVEASGVAGWCLRTASEYAKVRRQFGRPIGSFQAVKQLCAGMLCRAQRAAATAWDAACAYDTAPEEFPLAAAVAAAVAVDAAVDNAKDCVQVLGGIGFTWEHDAHLYLRRALALRALLGNGALWRERAADLALRGARRALRALPEDGGDAAQPHRERVRAIAALPDEQRRAALAEAGYLAPEWPPPYGLGASPGLQLAIDAELARVGVERPDIGIAAWAVPTILRFGTPSQRERFTGPSLRGEVTWCQLFSEPEAGSDLASLRTRAVRDADGWRLSGQKVWTSLAAEADWAICLARSEPAAPKHKGLTYFLVDMRTPGIEVRPLREMTGRAVFNEVFLDDVWLPDDCRVGEPGEGWRVARGTLAAERVAIGRGSSLGDEVERLIAAVRSDGREAEPRVRELLGGLVADGLAVSLLELRRTLQRLDGRDQAGGAAVSAAVAKLVGVAQRQAVAEAALLLCGAQGAAADGAGEEPVYQFLLTRCLSIAGGTTQILQTMVAEQVLGLPREGKEG